MKHSNKFKKGIIIGGLFTVFLVTLAVITFLPASIEGSYSYGQVKCMCGGSSFMRLTDGKIVMYNTEHSPADYIGTYTLQKNGMVSLDLFSEGGGTTLRVQPHLFFMVSPRLPGQSSGWDFRCPEIGPIARTIKTSEIMRLHENSDGSFLKEFFDSNFTLLRSETEASWQSAK